MRKFLFLAAITAVALSCDNSEAANRRVRTNSVPAGNGYAVQNGEVQGDGPFARLMEMERRKNAALRQMFFGR